MVFSKQQLEFRSHSFAEVGETLLQALPFLEELVAIGQSLRAAEKTSSVSLTCTSCPNRENCSERCNALNKLLPKVHQGRGSREHLTKLCFDDLSSIEKTGFLEIFEQYQACHHILTHKQWEVVYLYYHDGKTEEEIANETGKARTTVSDLLNRAKRKKEEYDKKLRREKMEYLKEKPIE